MEIVFLMVLPATLWAQSWYFLDLYNNTKTLGVMAATAAIMLGGMVIFTGGGFTSLVGGPPEVADVGAVLSTFILLWAIYLALLAGFTWEGLTSVPWGSIPSSFRWSRFSTPSTSSLEGRF